ncbi:12406_t:CDS:10 [Funneliformis geosporum]|uniref:26S proteasome regulatory subunit 4 homolog n=1 Tax=Funneliformis geosporum TaxID=1117311 RepID=A0A9W4SJE2_9GLOM|nr:12406_t:CDS:10 [Funneliformis geosporum]CAI2171241.1 8499_t:CDS:10 [Funneliformis geosporum]
MNFEAEVWNDITPIPQDDGPDPLAPIAYNAEYAKAMSYFRAVAQKSEHSERALDLTKNIIEHNPAHYTIWRYRQQILFALNIDLYEELDFVDDQIEHNPKNYQLWHHRQIIVEKLMDVSRELPFINNVLNEDAKNYHAWTYRQWVIRTFNLWEGELEFIDKILDKDVRNNSAWNQRYFAIFFNPNKPTDDYLAQEIKYVIERIKLAPNNISPWNYIKGVIAKSANDIGILEGLCKEIEEQKIISPHALGCLVDIHESRARNGSVTDKEEGIKICTTLAEKHDTIRKNYWEYRKVTLASGNTQSGGGLPLGGPGDDKKDDKDKDKKKKWEPPLPTRVGKKKKRGPDATSKLPAVFPTTRCRLKLLKMERIKDYLLMEEEFVQNQEQLKPQEEKAQEERTRVDDLRGSPMGVGTLEEIIDDDHAIISSSTGPEYYVSILSFVDKDLLEPGCSILLHHKAMSVVGVLQDDTDPMVSVMKLEKAPTESYADIGGLEQQIQEIKESVELPLTHPELYEEMGIKPPKGVILYGVPGTGKTLLAKAVANQTSATFLRVVGSELIQKYLGDGPKLVRELFRVAEEHAPSIVFIDEIDAIGTKRYESNSGGEREIQRTMLELLNQLDGFDSRGDVKVVMATNRIESLDPALIRPGRIDRKIEFPLPDVKTKRRIFNIHTSRMTLAADVDLEEFVMSKDDLSGADIKAICTESGLLALRERRMKVIAEDFRKAREKVLYRKTEGTPEGLYLEGLKESTGVNQKLERIESETVNSEEQIDPIYLEPQRIPPKHNIVVCHIHFRSYTPGPMDFFVDFARRTAFHLTIPCSGTIYLPTQRTRWTMPKGPFVHKKSQENFERKTHKRLLTFKDANTNVIDRLLLYLTKYCPPGIGMRVTRWEREDLGVGKRMLKNAKTKEESRMYKSVEKESVDTVDGKKVLSVGNVADLLIKGMEKDLAIKDDLKKSLRNEIDSESKDKVEISMADSNKVDDNTEEIGSESGDNNEEVPAKADST